MVQFLEYESKVIIFSNKTKKINLSSLIILPVLKTGLKTEKDEKKAKKYAE